MSSTTQTSTTEIRPFTVSTPEDELADLRRRIAATRWPDQETDASQGVQLETIQALADYPKLIHFNKVDEGGHFAAWEQPETLSEEIRATFRSLR
jgi:pimeloyl-ACP methyl ester carboxylesterase